MSTRQISDQGLGVKSTKKTKRLISPEGSFNIIRNGQPFSIKNVYEYLVGMSPGKFFLCTILGYFIINTLYAVVYLVIGTEQLSISEANSESHSFLNAFYFSFQTFSTVGYGGIHPIGWGANVVAALQTFTGLLFFAIASALIYGRFAKPKAKLIFSKNILIAPYQDGFALEFRMANARNNVLNEVEANVMLTHLEKTNKGYERKYYGLKLERKNVLFFPLNWTIVHPINEDSPLWDKNPQFMHESSAEVIIHIKGFDETFGQTVQARHSYVSDDLIWNARFTPSYHITEEGDIIFDLEKIGSYEAGS